MERLAILLGRPRERVERQAKAHRRVARDEIQVFAAQEPFAAHPPGLTVSPDSQRQGIADDLVQALLEYACQAKTLFFLVQPVLQRIDVDRQLPLTPHVVPDVLVTRDEELRADAQPRRHASREASRLGLAEAVVALIVR